MDNSLQQAFEQRLGKHAPSDPALRGKLFKPFAALKGYYEIIERTATPPEPKRNISDEEARSLNETLIRLGKGALVSVCFYEKDGYQQVTGAVREVDETFCRLVLVNKTIAFQDILAIEVLDDN